MDFKELSNYDKLSIVAGTLRYSQGFYSRLFQELMLLSEQDIEELNQQENFKKCESRLDVILELEQ